MAASKTPAKKWSGPKPMTREDVTDLIYSFKVQKGIKWADVAKKVGHSKEWVTAACLGQMTLTADQAKAIAKQFDLPSDAIALLHDQRADPRRIWRRHHERH